MTSNQAIKGEHMNNEEFLKEIQRRDEIIDSQKECHFDLTYLQAKLNAITTIEKSGVTDKEARRMIRALLIYG